MEKQRGKKIKPVENKEDKGDEVDHATRDRGIVCRGPFNLQVLRLVHGSSLTQKLILLPDCSSAPPWIYHETKAKLPQGVIYCGNTDFAPGGNLRF